MKAMLLAAGFGSRLKPLTQFVPKCLVPIKGKPLLEYWLEMLIPAGVNEIYINTHYLPNLVVEYLASSKWGNYVKVTHEDVLLGTGGTLLKNKKYFSDSDFMVIHADNLSKFDVKSFINFHAARPEHVDISMMTFHTDYPHSCGIVELDKSGIVVNFHEKVEKPPGNLANGAVYIMNPSVIDRISLLDIPTVDISVDVLHLYLGKIQSFKNDVYHRDIGSIESLKLANVEYNF